MQYFDRILIRAAKTFLERIAQSLSRGHWLAPAVIVAACSLVTSPALAWQGPTNITSAHNPVDGDYGPDLSEDPQGNLHLTYMGMYGGKWRVFHRIRPANGSWSVPAEIAASNDSDVFNVHSKTDADGNLHVVWSVGGNVGYGLAGTDVFYRKRSVNGSWGTRLNLSQSDNAASLTPDVAIASTGEVFVAWHEINPSNDWWEVAVARFDGSQWQPFQFITNDAAIDNTVALGMDAGNTLHLAWTTYDEVFYKTRSPAGDWSATINLSNNAGSSRDPRMFVTPAGVPHVVWHDLSLGNSWEMAYATRLNGAWSSPLNLSNNPDPVVDAYGSIGAGADGSVNVTWMDYSRIYYRRKAGPNWSNYIILPSGPQVGRGNKTFVDSHNNVHLVWEQAGDLIHMINDVNDVTPPGSPAQFMATPGNTTVNLKWTNPGEFDFFATLIRAKTSGYPTGPNDGMLVCNKIGTPGSTRECDHVNLTNGQTYYYAAFSYDQKSNYAPPAQISALPSGPADMDRDGDVDQCDFGAFQACMTGSAVPQADPACLKARLDNDEDVDLNDFAIFQACMSGANVPANPRCAD